MDKVQGNESVQNNICGECAKSYENEKAVYEHLPRHDNSENIQSRSVSTYKCDQCDHMYLKTDELKEHKIKAHQMYGCIYVCNGCDYKTSHITTFWTHKLKAHGDGPLKENNKSYANLFFNILARQQENMNDKINEQKVEQTKEFEVMKRVQDVLLHNLDDTDKMNYVITNCE